VTSAHDRAIAYITFSAAGPSGPENRLWGSATLDPPSRRPNPPATHDAPWKIRPRYDLARRGAVLPQNVDGEDIVVTATIPPNLPGGPYTAKPPSPGNRPG